MTRLSIEISVGEVRYKFVAQLHSPKNISQFHLDPDTFYDKWGGEVPSIPHFEIQIIEPVDSFFEKHTLHVHPSRLGGGIFVCYPRRIGSIEGAMTNFRVWCLGSVLTIEEKVDLNTVLEECDNDFQRAEQVMKDNYDICVFSTEMT